MARKELTTTVVTILRPLVRVLLRYGVAFGEFADLARWVYADVASREFGVADRKQSNSRVSILTGLSRKEVLRLRTQVHPGEASSADRYNRAARVISAWVREADFSDGRGNPADLPVDGGEASFAGLVRRFGGDVPHRAVLDELLRVGAVERRDDGRVRLVTRAYVPRTREGEMDKLTILGTDVAALISTIHHNLEAPPGEAHFQRKVSYEGLRNEALPRLRQESAARAQALLEELDRLFADEIKGPGGGPREPAEARAMVGIYYHEEPESTPEGGRVAAKNTAERKTKGKDLKRRREAQDSGPREEEDPRGPHGGQGN